MERRASSGASDKYISGVEGRGKNHKQPPLVPDASRLNNDNSGGGTPRRLRESEAQKQKSQDK